MLYIKTIFRNKKSYLYIAIISMLITILIIFNMFLGYYNHLLYEEVGNKIENRTLEVDNLEENNYINYSKNSEIENIYAKYSIKCKLYDKELNLTSYFEIQEQKDDNTIIINQEYAKKYNLQIGDQIKIVTEGIKKKFKIVGLTNNNYLNAYISQNDLDEIAKLTNKKPTSHIIIISKYKHVEKWITKINNDGSIAYIANNVGEQEIKDLIKLTKVSYYCISFFIIISLLFIYTIFMSINTTELDYNNMLIVLGCSKNMLRFQLFIRKCIIVLNSVLWSIAVILITNVINNSLVNSFKWFKLKYLNISNINTSLLIIIVLSFISSFHKCYKKIR